MYNFRDAGHKERALFSFFLFLSTLKMDENKHTALQQLPACPPPGVQLENCAWKTSTKTLANVYQLFPKRPNRLLLSKHIRWLGKSTSVLSCQMGNEIKM